MSDFFKDKLEEQGCARIFVPKIEEFDLREHSSIIRMYEESRPDIVIHLAAVVGGIGANSENPGKFFFDNAIMGIQLIHEGYLRKIEKMVILGTICCYPKFTPVPFKEEDIWNGYPEETNAPYGLAKKMLLVQAQAYRKQYGFNSIFLVPVNMFGPGDNFDPKASHVIPALVKKAVDSAGGKEEVLKRRRKQMKLDQPDAPITVWGTGNVTREFLFVEDAAEAIVRATENYNKSDPVNIGTGHEIRIKALVELINQIIGFNGSIIWDPSKPDGQPRRILDTSKAEQEFGFRAKIGLEEGLKRTIDWYLSTK
jgi:GDP-L-fucose synthase